jgi:lipoyltransferase/lipoate-protein ligase
MVDWRLLKLETRNAFENMAIDEAILEVKIKSSVPNTLRFYRWKPSAVSIGKFQNIEKEVQLDNCKKEGVDVVRRITGGGAVYHDAEGEITYSLIATKADLNAQDVLAVYARAYAGIAKALEILGMNVAFDEGNERNCPNLTFNGKKISGSAQSHKSGTVLQHGTLLLDVNLNRMFTFLRVPWAKTCMEASAIAERRITSVTNELGKKVSAENMEQALMKGFEKTFNTKLVNSSLTPCERELAEKLYREKYLSERWNRCGESKGS